MKKMEIKIAVVEVIECLEKARRGNAPASERAAHRSRAGEILQNLPARWWRRIPECDALIARMTELA